MKRKTGLLVGLLTFACATTSVPLQVKAATHAEASIQNDVISVRGAVNKSDADAAFAIKDEDCGYLTFAVFDLSLMAPVTDVTVLKLTQSQKEADEVDFETNLQMIEGGSVDQDDADRYVLIGSFEKEASGLTDQGSGSQFSCKLSFSDFTVDSSGDTIVQMNRMGYIAKENAALMDGPNDDLPSVGEDGLYLKLPEGTEVLVLYKGTYTYKIEYEGKQYYTNHENIRFSDSVKEDALAENIRKIIYEQSMLSEYYMYGISQFDLPTVEGGDLADVIELTREQLLEDADSVEEALKDILKKEKENGVSSGEVPDAYLDAVIEEDPMQIIGEAANDLYSNGKTEAIRERNEALKEKADEEERVEKYEEEHAEDILKIEIDKEVVGELLGKIWDTHLSDEIINAPADSYGKAITEDIYKGILGWDNRLPQNYEKLMECYTGTPGDMDSFDVLGDFNMGNDHAEIKGSLSQNEQLREYGDRLSEQMQGYIKDGKLSSLPFTYQTKNVSAYNRFLPGSLVVFEVVDFRILSVSTQKYLGVYAGEGKFYLPDYEGSDFDLLCSKIEGIKRKNGLIEITNDQGTQSFSKNASYGFLGLCYKNISVVNVYEADISLLNDPKYSEQDNSYFPMTAMDMSKIRYKEIEWQVENGWRPPKVWDD